MNWYKKAKKKYPPSGKLDTQLLCCGFKVNKRKKPYKKNKPPFQAPNINTK